MLTEKLTRILRSKSTFSEEQISQMTEGEGWRWVYRNGAPRKEKHFEICFTGFSASEKGSLSQLAADAGFMVVTAVTRRLSMLCIGPNPGPVKLEKAKQQQATTVTLEEFKHFLGTGEIPS
jgi:BRCT domain type II-containing protein